MTENILEIEKLYRFLYTKMVEDKEQVKNSKRGRTLVKMIGSIISSLFIGMAFYFVAINGVTLQEVTSIISSIFKGQKLGLSTVQSTTSLQGKLADMYANDWGPSYLSFIDKKADKLAVKNDALPDMFKANGYPDSEAYVSEGYYSQLIAVGMNDEATFIKNRRSITYNPETGLICWALGKDGQPIDIRGIDGKNAALDGDLDALAGGILGYKNFQKGAWKNMPAGLKDELLNHARSIFQNGVAKFDTETGGKFYVLKPTDATWCGSEKDGFIEYYTSYASPAWFELIANFLDSEGTTPADKKLAQDYRQLKTDTYALLAKILHTDGISIKNYYSQKYQLPSIIKVNVNGLIDSNLDNIGFEMPEDKDVHDNYEYIRLAWRIALDQNWWDGDKSGGKSRELLDKVDFQVDDVGLTSLNPLLDQLVQKYAFSQPIDNLQIYISSDKAKDLTYYRATFRLLATVFLANNVTSKGTAEGIIPTKIDYNILDYEAPTVIDRINPRELLQTFQTLHSARAVRDNNWLEDTDSLPIYSINNVAASHILYKAISKLLEDSRDFSRAQSILAYMLKKSYANMMFYAVPAYVSVSRDMGTAEGVIINNLLSMERERFTKAEEIKAAKDFKTNVAAQKRYQEYQKAGEMIRLYRYDLIAREKFTERVREAVQEIDKLLADISTNPGTQSEDRYLEISLRTKQVKLLLAEDEIEKAQTALTVTQNIVQQQSKSRQSRYYEKADLDLQYLSLLIRASRTNSESEVGDILKAFNAYFEDVQNKVVTSKVMIDDGISQGESLFGALGVSSFSPFRTDLNLPLLSKEEIKVSILGYYQAVSDQLQRLVLNGNLQDLKIVPQLTAILNSDPSGAMQNCYKFAIGEENMALSQGAKDRFKKDLVNFRNTLYLFGELLQYKAERDDTKKKVIEQNINSKINEIELNLSRFSLDDIAKITDNDIDIIIMPILKLGLQKCVYDLSLVDKETNPDQYNKLIAQMLDVISLYPQISNYLSDNPQFKNNNSYPVLRRVIAQIREQQHYNYANSQENLLNFGQFKQVYGPKFAGTSINIFDYFTKNPADHNLVPFIIKFDPSFILKQGDGSIITTKPDKVKIADWNNFLNQVSPKGYFNNVNNFAPYIAEVASQLYWSGNSDLKALAFQLMDSVIAEYPIEKGKSRLDGIKDYNFFITYYTMALMDRDNESANNIRGEALQDILRSVENKFFVIMREKGENSREFIQLLQLKARLVKEIPAGFVLLQGGMIKVKDFGPVQGLIRNIDGIYYDPGTESITVTKRLTEDNLNRLKQIKQLKPYWGTIKLLYTQIQYSDVVTDVNGLSPDVVEKNIAEMLDIYKTLGDIYQENNVEKANQFRDKAKALADKIENLPLVSGSLKAWLYFDMYQITNEHTYKQKLKDLKPSWINDAKFVQITEENFGKGWWK